MRLYHGSNVGISNPTLSRSRRALDFGAAFYLTSDLEQATRWAQRTARLRGDGHPLVTCFQVDDGAFASLRTLVFKRADAAWLRYVVQNRTFPSDGSDYDVVIGPVANDQTIRTINDYIRGLYAEEVALQLLLPQKLKDQYAFKTDEALSVLRYMEVRWV